MYDCDCFAVCDSDIMRYSKVRNSATTGSWYQLHGNLILIGRTVTRPATKGSGFVSIFIFGFIGSEVAKSEYGPLSMTIMISCWRTACC